MQSLIGRMGWILALVAVGISGTPASEPSGKEGAPRLSSDELRAAMVCYHKGLEAFRAGNWEAAAALMRASHELHPHFLPARFWLGRVQFEQRNWAGAAEEFRSLLTVNPKSLETRYWLGRALEAAGRTEEARQHYQAVLQAGLKGEDGRDAAARLKALSPGATAEAPGPPPPPPPTAVEGGTAKAAEAPEPRVETVPLESLIPAPAGREAAAEGPSRESAAVEPLPGMKGPAEEEQIESEEAAAAPETIPPGPPARREEPGAVPVPRLDGAAAAAALGEKLRQRQPVQVLILGDTFTAAPGVADPQGGYPVLFGELLETRFPDLNLQMQAGGLTNATSAQGLEALERDLKVQKPDVVVLHFGAYDQVGNVPLRAFQTTLRQMVAAVAQAAPAALILATPLVEGPPDGPYVQAVKEVARQAGATVADFEAAVKGQGQDHRGMFPFGQHPHEYAHTAAARELYRAFQSVVGEPQTLLLALESPPQYGRLGAEMQLPLRLSNQGPAPARGRLRVRIGEEAQEQPFDLPPGQETRIEFPLALPKALPNGRATQIRLIAVAEAEGTSAAEARWISVTPVLACPQVPALIQFDEAGAWAEKLPRNTLGPGNLVVGQVDQPADCRATFSLARDEEAVGLFLEVQDDQYQPTGSNIAAFNDCVELLFDLRPLEQRGQPFNTPQVFLLFVQLPADEAGGAVLLPLDTRPPGLEQVEAVFTPTDEGYRLQVALPLKFLEQAAGGEVDSFGFDLAIDDADTPGQRQAQLVWSGRADNFVNPRNFGEIYLKPDQGEKQVRITVW
jgi:lysophospholipase L1-like esterase